VLTIGKYTTNRCPDQARHEPALIPPYFPQRRGVLSYENASPLTPLLSFVFRSLSRNSCPIAKAYWCDTSVGPAIRAQGRYPVATTGLAATPTLRGSMSAGLHSSLLLFQQMFPKTRLLGTLQVG